MRTIYFVLFCLTPLALFSQKTFPVAAPSDAREGCYAFVNASIYLDHQTLRDGATLVIRKGKIEAVGVGVAVPTDAVVVDCAGKTIYPAFIDVYADGFGLPENKPDTASGRGFGGNPQRTRQGAFAWNDALKTDFNAAEKFHFDEKQAQNWLKLGFATLQTFQADGISRGTGAVVSLAGLSDHENLVQPHSAHFLSFRKGTSRQSYPSSLTGAIALLRQTFYDGKWYANGGHLEEKNLSLDAWNAVQSLPQIFEAGDKADIFRIAKLGDEFGVKFWIKTSGHEYQRLDELKKLGLPLIVGLNFPEGYDVRDPFDALDVPLKDLKHWELAPTNPARLAAAGIPFALTTAGLKDKSKFMEHLRRAIEHGLSEQTALQALTSRPAQLLNIFDKIGSIAVGKLANFIITDGNIFQKETRILQTWASGKAQFLVDEADEFPKNLYGNYMLTLDGDQALPMTIELKNNAPDAYLLRTDSSRVKMHWTTRNRLFTITFQLDSTKNEQYFLSGEPTGTTISGTGTAPNGRWISWSATQTAPAAAPKPSKQNPLKTPEVGEVIYPFTAFGSKNLPTASTFLIKNATVWTNETQGILTETDVLVSNGKIQQVGKSLTVPRGTTIVDATGMHLTPGIIDEHSHIAIARGVNEGTQESTAEVRMGDVIDDEDIDIYRQLAGGVTSSHLLHGSANPIGGQTQLIKLRWGYPAEALKFQNWQGFIKFALGENVKQSNWDIPVRTRYPQTRMGVEQVYIDYFTRAQEYLKLKKLGKNPRRDLDLEALAEILEGKRHITCHSYVQSEITMMMRLAERFGFKINTFTHILEGYKVADKMAKHGAGGSSFSDWWAYKMEVYQAIPYNAKIMADQGVLVAINSDDAEMARRLNQEAAKIVLYGGMSPEDALKTVTLNPAKLLRVDDRVGSIRVGKDADLVLWNAPPLSVTASASKTWVDGILFFDREGDRQLQLEVQTERARLIQKIQQAKKGGAGGEKPSRPRHHYHCEDMEDEG